MTFISELTDILLKNDVKDFRDIVVVLPSQRAKNSLLRELASRLDGPAFSPRIATIEELIQSLSPLRPADATELLITLFKVCQQHQFANCSDLREFMSWGPIFLQDINEIDMYNRNADDIFSDLSKIKELEFFGKEHLSEKQNKYLAFYYSLKEIAAKFKQQLKADKIGYNGLIYKYVATSSEVNFTDYESKKIYFAGLTALSPTELAIVKRISGCRGSQVEFLFDLDPFYFNEESNIHLTTLVKEIQKTLEINKLSGIKNHYKTIEKEIKIVGVGKKMSQIYIAIELLNKFLPEALNRTAVVMADESLIVPFVHAFDHTKCNITASYPVRYTTAYQLMHALFAAAQNLRRLQFGNGGTASYYFRDILAFFRNELVGQAFFTSEAAQQQYVRDIIQKGCVFLSKKDIQVDGKDIFPDLSTDGKTFIDEITGFFSILIENLAIRNDENNNEVALLTAFRNALAKVGNTLEQLGDTAVDLQTLLHFINDEVNNISLSFRGTQSEGLQVMGLLETRLLDFDNLIILGVNEGILPTGNSSETLLLFDVKRHYKLPTYEHKDAIGSYHFFRLLQRAQNISLVYDTDTSNSLTEESRFIRQLEFEVKKQGLTNSIDIRRTKMTVKPTFGTQKNSFEIQKTPEIIRHLTNEDWEFSATSLNCYINCSLQFYLKYIAHITEQDSVNENVEMNVIGSVIHEWLEKLFISIQKDQAGDSAHEKIFADAKRDLDNDKLTEIFKTNAKELKERDFTHGKLLLAVEVVKRYLSRYLEKVEDEFRENGRLHQVVATELEMKSELKLNETTVHFTGKADLIEKIGDITHIFDYKTGKIHELLMPEKMSDLFENPDYKQLFQLLLYAWLYVSIKQKESQNKHGKENEDPDEQDKQINEMLKNTKCEIIGFQAMMRGDRYIFPALEDKDKELELSSVLIKNFSTELTKIFKEKILNEKVPFAQTEDENRCQFCDYQGICGRQQKIEKF